MTTGKDPRGQILETKNYLDGTTRVKLDNGVVNTITIHCYAEQLPALLGSDMGDIIAHLMTRAPGHFRRK
jgi:hypothetical protein